MVAGSKQVGIHKAITANGTEEATTSLMSGAKNLILLIEVSDYTDGSYDLELFHSPNGSDFESLGSCPTISAAGFAKFEVSGAVFETFKLELTSSLVTSGATIKASIMYTANRL
jgi:hypothetical protein